MITSKHDHASFVPICLNFRCRFQIVSCQYVNNFLRCCWLIFYIFPGRSNETLYGSLENKCLAQGTYSRMDDRRLRIQIFQMTLWAHFHFTTLTCDLLGLVLWFGSSVFWPHRVGVVIVCGHLGAAETLICDYFWRCSCIIGFFSSCVVQSCHPWLHWTLVCFLILCKCDHE